MKDEARKPLPFKLDLAGADSYKSQLCTGLREAIRAGKWLALDRDNRMGECDITRITTELLRVNDAGDLTDDPAFGWEDGWIAWEIPFGWTTNEAIRENPKAPPLRVFDPNAGHRIEITSAGLVTVRKFGNCVQRDVGGRMTCNGVEVIVASVKRGLETSSGSTNRSRRGRRPATWMAWA